MPIHPAAKWKIIQEYVERAVRSFEFDGADSPYQNGYLDALKTVQKEVERLEKSK